MLKSQEEHEEPGPAPENSPIEPVNQRENAPAHCKSDIFSLERVKWITIGLACLVCVCGWVQVPKATSLKPGEVSLGLSRVNQKKQKQAVASLHFKTHPCFPTTDVASSVLVRAVFFTAFSREPRRSHIAHGTLDAPNGASHHTELPHHSRSAIVLFQNRQFPPGFLVVF